MMMIIIIIILVKLSGGLQDSSVSLNKRICGSSPV